MLKLLRLADDVLNAGESCILCSVVRLQGSGYGRVGARLLITQGGEREGYISGGCLEKDLCRRALQEARTHPKLISFDTRGNAITPTRYGTGCEGVVYVLCQPLSLASHIYRVASLVARERRVARILTIYRSDWDHACIGESVAQFNDGTFSMSTQCANASTARLFENVLNRLPGCFTATIAGTSRGTCEVVVETLEPSRRLVIFGAGDDVKPVAQIAVSSGWEVYVVGKHPHLANKQRFPHAQVLVGDIAELAGKLVADEYTHVISMSHDFAEDLRLVPALLRTPLKSIGLLGSKRRLARLLAELHFCGERLTAEQIDRIRSPLGLDIGAESPDDIALSIMSELVAIDKDRSGMRLSDKNTTIHSQLPHHSISLGELEDSTGSITHASILCDRNLDPTSPVEGP